MLNEVVSSLIFLQAEGIDHIVTLDNIVVDCGTYKLTECGISSFTHEDQFNINYFGTNVPPERTSKPRVVWGVGIVLFEVMFYPCKLSTMNELPDILNVDITGDERMSILLRGCLHKNPMERFKLEQIGKLLVGA